ncbi:MAG: acetyl-CoA carboxylase, carboxyltransferase subunit beta [Lachnospiraceae bacterium]|nr:acetyl-CoA carboxylase, carboxyltransferase subunit beta [Lachnospiraceae bacterium]
MMNDIFHKRKKSLNHLLDLRKPSRVEAKITCPHCKEEVLVRQVKENHKICPKCGFYFPMTPEERILSLADTKSFREQDKKLRTGNPLDFPEYEEKLAANEERTGHMDAVMTGTMMLNGIETAIAVMDGRFLMGSMGTVVGEKIVRITEYAGKKKLPLIIFSASGGARMQEGLFSLMQMAKTSAAVEKFKKDGGLFISVLTNPTTGGVSASFANLGDIIIAEPKALICFAGPRVIEQTIGQKLPKGFQRAEFLLEHGMVDMVTERKDLKEVLYKILKMHR